MTFNRNLRQLYLYYLPSTTISSSQVLLRCNRSSLGPLSAVVDNCCEEVEEDEEELVAHGTLLSAIMPALPTNGSSSKSSAAWWNEIILVVSFVVILLLLWWFCGWVGEVLIDAFDSWWESFLLALLPVWWLLLGPPPPPTRRSRSFCLLGCFGWLPRPFWWLGYSILAWFDGGNGSWWGKGAGCVGWCVIISFMDPCESSSSLELSSSSSRISKPSRLSILSSTSASKQTQNQTNFTVPIWMARYIFAKRFETLNL